MTDPTPARTERPALAAARRDLRTAARRHARLRRRRAPDRGARARHRRGSRPGAAPWRSRPSSTAARCCAAATASCAWSSCCAAARAPARARVRVPTDLVVVLDRSGSMAGEPIATALAALRELIAGLADGDRFALVSYASDARVDVPLEAASGSARERWSRADRGARRGRRHEHVGRARPRPRAARGRRAARERPARLIVLSDGHANQGDYSLEGLRARAGRARAGEYVLSAVGIGNGFDETVMSALADAGTGNFYYLPDAARLAGVFAGEFAAARETVARALAVRIAPGAGVRVADAGGYPLETADGGVSFHPGDLFAGQERRMWLTLHAPTRRVGRRAARRCRGGVRHDRAASASASSSPRCRRSPASRAKPTTTPRSTPSATSAPTARDSSASSSSASRARSPRGARPRRWPRSTRTGALEPSSCASLGYVDRDGAARARRAARPGERARAAAPEGANRLGKELLESGRDDQRAGAKND